jgi:hypothetical protein
MNGPIHEVPRSCLAGAARGIAFEQVAEDDRWEIWMLRTAAGWPTLPMGPGDSRSMFSASQVRRKDNGLHRQRQRMYAHVNGLASSQAQKYWFKSFVWRDRR